MTTWEECRAQVLARVAATREMIRKKHLRADAFERVMTNHINATGYPPEFKARLLDVALGKE